MGNQIIIIFVGIFCCYGLNQTQQRLGFLENQNRQQQDCQDSPYCFPSFIFLHTHTSFCGFFYRLTSIYIWGSQNTRPLSAQGGWSHFSFFLSRHDVRISMPAIKSIDARRGRMYAGFFLYVRRYPRDNAPAYLCLLFSLG